MGRKRASSTDSNMTTTSHSPTKSLHSNPGGMQQRNAANARERARMRVLSKAFIKLKTHLPWVPHDTKLSKLDTLRLATSYILHLTQILDNDEFSSQSMSCSIPAALSSSSLPSSSSNNSLSIQAPNNFSWPYSSCHRASSLCSINSRMGSSSALNSANYSNPSFDYRHNTGSMIEHQENLIEEKPRLC